MASFPCPSYCLQLWALLYPLCDCIVTVMLRKLFLRCVGDLATVGGSVLVVTSFRPINDFFFVCLFVCEA